MDNPRLFLFLALFMLVFMIWQAWQVDYGPKPDVTAVSRSTSQSAKDKTQAQLGSSSDDTPEASQRASNKPPSTTTGQVSENQDAQGPNACR